MASKKPDKAPKKAVQDRVKPISELSDQDQFTTPHMMNFATRAGLPSYRRELQERLQDVFEAPANALFLLPVKLTKDRYKQLILAAIDRNNAEWTEQDEIHALIKAASPLKPDKDQV